MAYQTRQREPLLDSNTAEAIEKRGKELLGIGLVVLGVMAANDLDDAIRIQNSSAFGLTGGIQSLDPHEIETWTDRVEVGNAYVNRGITGAIVQRQPFGGWKASSVGSGSKAGGPNYVAQFGTWMPVASPSVTARDAWLTDAIEDDEIWWSDHFWLIRASGSRIVRCFISCALSCAGSPKPILVVFA